MNKNTSVSLGSYFESFVQRSIAQGRYKNASEVIRAGLRRLDEEDQYAEYLRMEIQRGIDSGPAVEFDSEKHLAMIKARRANG